MNIKELLITQPSLEQVLGAYPSKKPPNCTIRDYDFALMSMMQLEQNRDIAELKCLLQPCSFGQAVVMMEKGAVMKCVDDSFMRYVGSDFLSLSSYMLFVYKDKWVHDPSIQFNLLYANDWQYAPWFKDGVVDKEIKDFCDEILGVKND